MTKKEVVDVTSCDKGKASGVFRPAMLLVAAILLLLLGGCATLSGDVVEIPLVGTDLVPEATGTLLLNGDETTGTLVVIGLPTLDPSEQYQLWLVQDGQLTSGAVFSADEYGTRRIRVTGPNPLTTYSDYYITVEPTGGSSNPIGPTVMEPS